ncbi:MAG: glycoside hydrolase [Muricauda sp.]|nr:glycoside hydrolase [Allomuricauda sp.]
MKKLIVLVLFVVLACGAPKDDKVNGISFVSSGDRATQTHIDPVLDVHANYAAIMPFGFIPESSSPELIFDSERQWYGETSEGVKQYIQTLHKNGVKVMLKPQIWIRRGEFTGNLTMKNDKEWEEFEGSYADFIMLYAQVAQETQTDILCIGTELAKFVQNRPEFWNDLIKKVKTVYHGKLTYAANWDEYAKTPFWNQLDFIGVNAYFPLCEKQNPTTQTLREGWQPWKAKLKSLSEKVGKPMLFTEFGYRSMDYTGKKPWLVDRNEMNVNLKAQADATQVIFDEFWTENWFAGGFVWKWFMHHDRVGGQADNRFTPQNKPAESVIRKQYALARKSGA